MAVKIGNGVQVNQWLYFLLLERYQQLGRWRKNESALM